MSETWSEPRGERIGRYEILGELGHGAMGVVYKARDPHLDRIVAIKALRVDPALSRDQRAEIEKRFSQEAVAAGRLNHPNIVAVYDVVDVERIPHIVMECVEGRTLAEVIASGDLRLPATVGLAMQVCAALDYAHARGVVHRDIKPSNIMVTETGQAKVSDFGIARISGRKVTQTGALLGTPAYMSPEQVCGRDVDGRSDLFSLGLVLYEAITGRDAFRADDPTAVLYQIVHEEPIPIRELVPSVSPALDGAIRRALAKRPDERYATAGAFADALRATIGRADDRTTILMPATSAPEARPRRRKRSVVLAGGATLALVIVVVGGGMVLRAQRPARIPTMPEPPGPPSSVASRPPAETARRPAVPSPDTGPAERGQPSSEVTVAVQPPSSPPAPSSKPEMPEAPALRTTNPSRVDRITLAAPARSSPSVAGAPPRQGPSVRAAPPSPGPGLPATPLSPGPSLPATPLSPGPSLPATAAPPAHKTPTPVAREPASGPAPEARPASPTPEEVKAQITALLRGSDKLAGVKVEVTPRLEAHLSGRVWNEEALGLAVKLAGSVKGVTEVTQNIVVAMREMNEKFRQAVEGGTIRRTP